MPLSVLFQYTPVGINATHRVNVRRVNGASVFLCPVASVQRPREAGEKRVEARGGGGGRLVIEKSARLRCPPLFLSGSSVSFASYETCRPCRFVVSTACISNNSAHDSHLSSIGQTIEIEKSGASSPLFSTRLESSFDTYFETYIRTTCDPSRQKRWRNFNDSKGLILLRGN